MKTVFGMKRMASDTAIDGSMPTRMINPLTHILHQSEDDTRRKK